MRLHATATLSSSTPRRGPSTWLVALLLLCGAALGGCGQGEPTAEPTADSPTSEESDPLEPESQKPSTPPAEEPEKPEKPAGGPLDEPGLVALESASQAEGATDAPPVVIERVRDVTDLTAGLDARLADAVRARARALLPRVADDLELVASVVWVGCEIPSDVTVDGAGDDVTLTAVVSDKGSVQCLVPVTTVAFATAPRA